MIDYELVTRLLRKHKAAVTRAKKKGPDAIIAACDAAFADFEAHGYPDDWAHFERARDDARFAQARAAW